MIYNNKYNTPITLQVFILVICIDIFEYLKCRVLTCFNLQNWLKLSEKQSLIISKKKIKKRFKNTKCKKKKNMKKMQIVS